MDYQSTRNSGLCVSSAQAIAQGISEDGGLFIPKTIPSLTLEEIKNLCGKSYAQAAVYVFSKFLTDFSEAEIKYCVDGAYNTENFDSDNIMELAHLFDGRYMLELWHGPTCAFKDMALQILPYLLTTSIKNLGIHKKVIILVATSGDTGKAALEGFKDVEGTQILVFYPVDGVSRMQKLQMTTQEGSNVAVCAIKGNFDDAQSGVKKIFTDREVEQKLDENKMMFSSANSINWGRLAPQIVYYVYSYVKLVDDEQIKLGDKINICVPTGNFGNILAAYYAKMMGIPVNKLICASNSNNVLTDFINTGVYDRNRKFYTTISPSMDILVSSNLERLIFDMENRDPEKTIALMKSLSETGKYDVGQARAAQLKETFYANFCGEESCAETIGNFFEEYEYVLDPHTAVAMSVYDGYVCENGSERPAVILSTASPYKFPSDVYEAITGKYESDPFVAADKLEKESAVPVPEQISALKSKAVRFDKKAKKEDLKDIVRGFALNK